MNVAMVLRTLLHLAALIALPPLLLGVVNRTKAIFAGRVGPPLLQPYFDLAKLLRKGAVYSRTTTWVFRAGPVVGLAAVGAAGLLLAMGGAPAALSFGGDFVLFAYLLGLARFFTALAALDTGSAFEGMGAAREVTFASLAEPSLFLCLLVLARATGTISLSGMLGPALPAAWGSAGAALLLAAIALFVIALAENSRIPVSEIVPVARARTRRQRKSAGSARLANVTSRAAPIPSNGEPVSSAASAVKKRARPSR